MSLAPLRSTHRKLYSWFATRPDLFASESSPRKRAVWTVVAVVMVVLSLTVYLNAEATVELLGGRVKGGLAIAGAFALPPVLVVVSIVMIFVGSRRWRVKGGGVLTNPVIYGVDGSFPIRPLLETIRNGHTDAAEITEGFAAAQDSLGDDLLLSIWSSDADRVMYVGVLRVDGDAVWLDEQPFRVDGSDYFDAKALAVAASRRPPRVAGP